MAKCEICDKHVVFGRNIRYGSSGSSWLRRAQKTNRTFKPNIQKTTLTVEGASIQIKVCTKCLRSLYKTR
ncbi:MAG: 50S ribosomal protein L28 [Roseiflexaceae bacterium]|jgi:large subunit ribosomal protein L28